MPNRASILIVDGRTFSDAELDSFWLWLTVRERARYKHFVRKARQRQFLIGRVLARQAVGRMLGVPAQTLAIDEVAGQKPFLCGAHGPVYFSISHSGPWVACAVGVHTDVGLDIETIDPARDTGALARQAFDGERCAWLAARPNASRLRDFYTMWSAQEAAIKLGAPVRQTVQLFHPELSIVLCCAHELDVEPQLVAATISR